MTVPSCSRPWEVYGSDVRPSSAGRLLLADLLEFVMTELGGLPEAGLAETFLRSDKPARDDQASVRSYARWLGLHFLSGELVSSTRPVGGGEIMALPPSRWEIDDFLARFAFSALDPVSWWDAAATPTHWIFVTEESVDRWWQRWSAGEVEDVQSLPIIVERRGSEPSGTADEPLALLRLAEVEAMTGMSRSTLYDRIRTGAFPEPLRLGSRMSRWRRGDVLEWLRQTAA